MESADNTIYAQIKLTSILLCKHKFMSNQIHLHSDLQLIVVYSYSEVYDNDTYIFRTIRFHFCQFHSSLNIYQWNVNLLVQAGVVQEYVTKRPNQDLFKIKLGSRKKQLCLIFCARPWNTQPVREANVPAYFHSTFFFFFL